MGEVRKSDYATWQSCQTARRTDNPFLANVKQAPGIFEKELVRDIFCKREFSTIGYSLTERSVRN
jgi:hypothetical protein